MEEEGVQPPAAPGIDVFFAVEDGAQRSEVARIVADLRRAGVSAESDHAGRSLKGQLTQAGRLGAARTVVVTAEKATLRAPGAADEQVLLGELVGRLVP
jgi:histidyl-tRNA synthetase